VLYLISHRRIAALLLGTLLAAHPAYAFDVVFSGRTVKRELLALYDGRQEGAPHLTRLHKLAEMPINHLGYFLTYQDVNAPLPDPANLKQYRAIVTWFVEPLEQPAAYIAWLEQAVEHGLNYVVLGEFAPRETDDLMPALNRILARLGLEHKNNFVELTYRARVVMQDPQMVGFERKLDKVLPGFPVITARPGTRAHLVLEAMRGDAPITSVILATGERGGFVAQNYTVLLDPNTDRVSWLIDPFRFFQLALGDERFPVPDVTTVTGRRLYFSQIDGDGWNNVSEIEHYREAQTLSSEVIARETIEAYRDLPVSVGLIAGDAQPLLGGIPGAARVARRLFALPNVEVASHTHSHPYNWSFYENYDRRAEEQRVNAYRPPEQPMRERFTAALLRAAGKEVPPSRFDKYVAGSDDLPRTYLRKPFNLELEVQGALKFSEQLAPKGKPAKLYLWSGDATPFEAAVRATRAAGVRNLNGGDSRLDKEYPSIAYVPPIARPVGKERQIYAVNSNENTYTNEWNGPFGGQLMLEYTLANTERPRRLKGFDLYYHMYSGEKQAALTTVKHFLDIARTSEVAPISASHYAAIADDFFGVTLEQLDFFSWAVSNRGALQTVRFDEADELDVDLAASTGVLGANRHERALYIALDAAVDRAVVTLRPRLEATVGTQGAGDLLSLVHSRWRLSARKFEGCGLTIEAEGYGPGEMLWQTRSGQTFAISAERYGQALAHQVRTADASGRLGIRLETSAIEPLTVRLSCQD
jgi:polysaccharide biosynthesis protein PelA